MFSNLHFIFVIFLTRVIYQAEGNNISKTGLQCFKCTDLDKGCGGEVSGDNFKTECKPDTTGCLVIVVRFKYPIDSFVYRDCLYEEYLKCSGLALSDYVAGDVPHEINERSYNLKENIKCINKERQKKALPLLPTGDIPRENGEMAGNLYVSPTDLSNGLDSELVGPKSRPPVPSRVDNINCFTCDSKSPPCDGNAADLKLNSVSCGMGAYGCAILYEEDPVKKVTTWFRRECWYQGDLTCLKGRKKGGSSRSLKEGWKTIPTKCNARLLLDADHSVVWEDNKVFTSKDEYTQVDACRTRVAGEFGVTREPLPAMQTNKKTIQYFYCTPSEKCNAKQSKFYVKPKPPPPPPPPPVTTPPPPPVTAPPPPPVTTPPPPPPVVPTEPPTNTGRPPPPPPSPGNKKTKGTDDLDITDCKCLECSQGSAASSLNSFHSNCFYLIVFAINNI